MGNNSSKTTPASEHVWQSSETPIQFSQNFVESLQSSPENDSTRAKTLELHIQTRVHEELQRLQAREDKAFADISSKLSTDDSGSPSSTPSPSDDASAPPATGTLTSSGSKTPLGREMVLNEVQDLRRKLEARKKIKELEELDRDVDKARDEVVRCLRGNDRRPLDCWREVETFREVVGRVERGWVEKTLR